METEIITAYVSLGSNLGDRAGNLLARRARASGSELYVVNKLSAIYETEPVGVESQRKFLNMVAEIHITGISAFADDGANAPDRISSRAQR